MIKKMIPEFAVKNSQEAIEFYKNILRLEVLRIVTANGPGVPVDLSRTIANNEKAVTDSLLKINNDYFKIYEWNEKFDGPYDEKTIRPFNIHLQFKSEEVAKKLWNNFLEHKKSREINKFNKIKVGDFEFMVGILQDPYNIRWTFTYYPNSNEIN